MISCTCKLLSAKNEHPVRYDQSACPTHGPDAPNYFVDHDTIHCRITGKHVSLDEAAGMLNASPDELRMIAWGVVAKIGPQLREVTNERDSLRTRLAALEARAAELEHLRSFVQDFADEDCEYNDNCPSNARHYRCYPCKAKDAIRAAKEAK